MTFPVASLANIIVALISQSLISTPSYVTNMSHHPHFGYRTPDRDISPRAFNEKSPAAKSSNSNRSFPAGPLRSSLALICVATNHGYLSLSLFFKKSATLDSYSRTVSAWTITNLESESYWPPLKIVKPRDATNISFRSFSWGAVRMQMSSMLRIIEITEATRLD